MAPLRFTLGKQSSMAPDRDLEPPGKTAPEEDNSVEVDPGVRLMYLANEGDLDGIKELLDSGIDVNFCDIDDRTALHVAACQGLNDVVKLLIDRGAKVDTKDRWGSTVRIADGFFFFFWKKAFDFVEELCNVNNVG